MIKKLQITANDSGKMIAVYDENTAEGTGVYVENCGKETILSTFTSLEAILGDIREEKEEYSTKESTVYSSDITYIVEQGTENTLTDMTTHFTTIDNSVLHFFDDWSKIECIECMVSENTECYADFKNTETGKVVTVYMWKHELFITSDDVQYKEAPEMYIYGIAPRLLAELQRLVNNAIALAKQVQ